MPNEKRSRIAVRADAAVRLALWHGIGRRSGDIFLAEYPKSGGSWLSQMISAYAGIHFPRNEGVALIRREPCLLQGHYCYSKRFRNVVCMFRDGRDVTVSAYYFLFFLLRDTPTGRAARRRVEIDDVDDVRAALPRFIDALFGRPFLGGRLFRYRGVNWAGFVRSWLGKPAVFVTYESLLERPVDELIRVGESLMGIEPDRDKAEEVVRKFSFQNQTGRKRSEQDNGSFLRKGIAGDWKNHFSKDACERFDHYAGDELIAAGYESDRSWIDDVTHT